MYLQRPQFGLQYVLAVEATKKQPVGEATREGITIYRRYHVKIGSLHTFKADVNKINIVGHKV